MKDPLINAISIAIRAHADQKDLIGSPYIHHPLRVLDAIRSQMPDDIDAQVAAVLHDVIEDGGFSPARLIQKGVSVRAAGLVAVLSRLPMADGKKKPYHLFIGDIKESGDPVAIAIKLADLVDNLDPRRAQDLPPIKRASLGDRYMEAIEILIS